MCLKVYHTARQHVILTDRFKSEKFTLTTVLSFMVTVAEP